MFKCQICPLVSSYLLCPCLARPSLSAMHALFNLGPSNSPDDDSSSTTLVSTLSKNEQETDQKGASSPSQVPSSH